MGRKSSGFLVPVVYDPANGLTLYEVVQNGEIFAGNDGEKGDLMSEGLMLEEDRRNTSGSIAGHLLGILAFLGGIAILVLTFRLAIEMFGTDPAKLFDLQPGKTLDLSKAATILMGVVIKVLLLLVMAIVGGLIANRGIHLYADSRQTTKQVVIREKQVEAPAPKEKLG
jgi:hypothetical protein